MPGTRLGHTLPQAETCRREPCACTLCTCVRLHAYLPQHLVLLIVRRKPQEASQIVQGNKHIYTHVQAADIESAATYLYTTVPYSYTFTQTHTDRSTGRRTYVHICTVHMKRHTCMHACSYIRGSILPAVLVCMIRHITRSFRGCS